MAGARLDPEVRTDALDGADMRADLREAYERGRRDERGSRKRHPVFMTLTFVAALVGVVILGLAAINGSFTQAGGVVDQNLRIAVSRAGPQVRAAASQAGQSLKDAGRPVQSKAPDAAG